MTQAARTVVGGAPPPQQAAVQTTSDFLEVFLTDILMAHGFGVTSPDDFRRLPWPHPEPTPLTRTRYPPDATPSPEHARS